MLSKIFSDRKIFHGLATTLISPTTAQSTTGVLQRPSFDVNSIIHNNNYDGINQWSFNVAVESSSESTIRIPDYTTAIEFQARDSVAVRWSFVSGKAFYSQSPYFTMKSDDAYNNTYPNEGLVGESIYFASAGDTTVELRAYSVNRSE